MKRGRGERRDSLTACTCAIFHIAFLLLRLRKQRHAQTTNKMKTTSKKMEAKVIPSTSPVPSAAAGDGARVCSGGGRVVIIPATAAV